MPRSYHPQEVVDYCIKALQSKQLTAHELAALFDTTDTTIYRWSLGQARTKFEPNRGLEFCRKAALSDQDECVLWPYSTNKNGYGKITVDRKSTTAHRVVSELVHGPAPKEKPFALHSCDISGCVNPKHLRWGSAHENSQERDQKGRANTPRGCDFKSTLLTEELVLEIRKIAKPGNFGELAKLYGVSRQCIAHAYHRRSWDWLP